MEISWVVVGATLDDTLAQLDLEDTGEPVREGADEWAGASLPHGGALVLMNQFWHPWVRPERLQPWSRQARVLGCTSSARTNTSVAFLWRRGELDWQVSHVLDEGEDHLDIVGIPPRERLKLLKQAQAERATSGGDTVFDVPAQLAALLCGYRHGQGLDQGVGLTRLRPRGRFGKALRALGGIGRRRTEPVVDLSNRDTARAWLMEAIGTTLEPLGFRRQPVPWGGYHWERDTPTALTTVSIAVYGVEDVLDSDTLLSVKHKALFRLAAAANPHRTGEDTGSTSLTLLEGRRNFLIDTPLDARQYLAFVAKALPPLLARCEEPAVLARLVNQGRREMWELDPLDTTLSLVLAYVTANPHFAAMLAQADERLVKQSEQDATHYQRFEALLRRQGPPGTLEGRRVV